MDIYRKRYEKMEHFVVRADRIEKDGRIFYEGAAMLVWPRGVFYRIRTKANPYRWWLAFLDENLKFD